MQGLSAIRGQERAIFTLRRALAAGRLGSAYLFEGAAGVGKATAALALAQAIACERAPGSGCGECDACHSLEEDTHPDYAVVRPDGQFIKISQVRQLLS